MRFPSVLVVALLLCGSAFAQCENGQCRMPVRNVIEAAAHTQPVRAVAHGAREFAKHLVQSSQLHHDPGFAGRENVFYSSNPVFSRVQARVAWRASPGHRANLPMFGLRVARGSDGVYVVGRR